MVDTMAWAIMIFCRWVRGILDDPEEELDPLDDSAGELEDAELIELVRSSVKVPESKCCSKVASF